MGAGQLVWGLLTASLLAAGEPDAELLEADRQLLRTCGVADEGPVLLTFLRRQVPTEDGRRRIAELIRDLGANAYAKREEASRLLVEQGRGALAPLREAAGRGEPEVRRRATECMERIERSSAPPVLAAAARRLAAHRTPQATTTPPRSPARPRRRLRRGGGA